ncbi:MAG: YIP1 family protein [Longimicrobiales bacterium]
MAGTGGSLVARMIGAAMLSTDTFEEVEHDETATGQAATVVAMVAAASAIGASGSGLFAAGWAAGAAVVGWAVWAGLTFVIGTKLFDGRATWGEVMRAIGFAQAPGILLILGILPLMGLWLWVVPIWMMIAGFIGLREALDIGGFKTFFTILIGAVAYAFLRALTPF